MSSSPRRWEAEAEFEDGGGDRAAPRYEPASELEPARPGRPALPHATGRSCPTTSSARCSTKAPAKLYDAALLDPRPSRTWSRRSPRPPGGPPPAGEGARKGPTSARRPAGGACSRGRRRARAARGSRIRQGVGPGRRRGGARRFGGAGAARPGRPSCAVDARASQLEPPDAARVLEGRPRRCARQRPARQSAGDEARHARATGGAHRGRARIPRGPRGDSTAPFAGKKGALDGAWSKKQRDDRGPADEAAQEAEAAARAETARRADLWRAQPEAPHAVAGRGAGLDPARRRRRPGPRRGDPARPAARRRAASCAGRPPPSRPSATRRGRAGATRGRLAAGWRVECPSGSPRPARCRRVRRSSSG